MVTNPRFYQTHRQNRHLLFKTNLILQRMGSADLPAAN